jgi:undecaprenyl-diphosphatase
MTAAYAAPLTAQEQWTSTWTWQNDPMRDDLQPRTHDETIGSRDLTSWRSRTGKALVGTVAGFVRWAERSVGPLVKWSAANLAFVVFAAATGIVVVGLTAVFHKVQESVVDHDGITAIDQPVLDAALALRSPGLNDAITTYTDVGGPIGMPIVAAAAVAILVAIRRRWTPVVLVTIAALGSLAMTIVGKGIVGRMRPPTALAVPPFEDSPSFPSGHTLNATVLVTVIVYLVLIWTTATWQRVLAVAVGGAFIVTMGLSRVFLGHHWLTDVIAGWAIGLAWALAVITAHRLWLTLHRAEQKAGPVDAAAEAVAEKDA